MLRTPSPLLATLLAGYLALTGTLAMAHGDVVPQSVDTSSLPQLGPKWLDNNPYTS
ncbi:MAG: cytochrome c-550 PedF, partial [Rhodoferax sp.]|nr:cytochrome c-550 PedF [Rhodoferax sp.]